MGVLMIDCLKVTLHLYIYIEFFFDLAHNGIREGFAIFHMSPREFP